MNVMNICTGLFMMDAAELNTPTHQHFCTSKERMFSCKFSICLLWWHLTLQHKHCWAGITTFTAFSHGHVGGWTETTNPQNAALITPAVAFLPGKKHQENNHFFSHQRKMVHFCQTSGIRMEIGQIKSSAAGLKTSPSWKIFPNGKYEPRDHRCWKREWYAVNNDHLRPCGNQATVNLLLQTERIYLSIPLWQFPFQNEVICAGRPAVKALAATSHCVCTPNPQTERLSSTRH